MTAKRTTAHPGEPKIPQRPKSLSYHYENNGDALTLRQKRQISGACFMALWLTGWTVACVMLIWKAIQEPELFTFCFAIPFWVGWFFGFGVLILMLFGKDSVTLDHDGLFNEYHIVFRIISKQVPLDEIRYFHAIQSEGSESVSYSVEAVTFGNAVQFSTPNLEEAEWLAHEMNQLLAAHKGVSQWEVMPDVAEADNAHDDETDEQIAIPLNSRPQDIEPPGDCSWKRNAEFDSVTFAKRGEFSLVALGTATFTMLFWNGIVSVFVLGLWGVLDGPEFLSWEWWILFVFLIPFQVIGFCLVLAWLLSLFAPFQHTRWHFTRDTATCRVRWFGLGRSWLYSLENCDRMVIDAQEPGGGVRTKIRQQLSREAKSYNLTFVDDQNVEVCSINDLTLGEAHWIANGILEYR